MDILAALCIAMMCYALSGARSWAYGLYFASFVPFISLSAVEGGLTDVSGLSGGNVGFKLLLRCACTLGFLFIIAREKDSLSQIFRTSSLPILILFAWGLAWVGRSQAPWISLFRLGELFTFFLAGVALYLRAGRRAELRDVLRWHCLALLTLPLLGLWFSWFRPSLMQHQGSGDIIRWGHKLLNANSLGFSCVVVILWATHELKHANVRMTRNALRECAVPLFALLTCALVFVMARSRSAALLLAFGQMVLWWPSAQFMTTHRLRLGMAAMIGLGFLGWQWSNIQPWFLRGETMASLVSATGRTDLWRELITEQAAERPIAGSGYLMLSKEGGFQHQGRVWTNAHNTYLFALMSTGWIGFLSVLNIVFWPLWVSARRAWRAPKQDSGSERLLFALISIIAMASITGFGIFGYPNPAMLLFYSLYALILAEKRPEGVRSVHGEPYPLPTGFDPTPMHIR